MIHLLLFSTKIMQTMPNKLSINLPVRDSAKLKIFDNLYLTYSAVIIRLTSTIIEE